MRWGSEGPGRHCGEGAFTNSIKESENMWAKVEIVHCDAKIVWLPPLRNPCGETGTEVIFGGKSTRAEIGYQEDLRASGENNFETPAIIRLSDALQAELFIEANATYQLEWGSRGLRLGPVIGLLLGEDLERYTPQHMTKYSDRFGVYPRIGGLIYAFAPQGIRWNNRTVYGLYYNYGAGAWEYGQFPFPEAIYRRDFHTDPGILEGLVRATGGKLFNSYRFTKVELFEFMKRDPELAAHIPPTEPTRDFDQIKAFIDHYHKVILKPVHLSRGRGICVIEQRDCQYRVTDFRCKRPLVYELYNEQLFEYFFDVYRDLFDKYLIQQFLPLARIGEAPFDIRAVMQKRPDGDWGCTGGECRVSNNGYLTNISRGGYALTVEEALSQAFPDAAQRLLHQIAALCQKVCRHLDTSGAHLAELGLDIAVDREAQLWLIEANVFPSFKGFKKIDPEIYLAIRHAPLLYASALTGWRGA